MALPQLLERLIPATPDMLALDSVAEELSRRDASIAAARGRIDRMRSMLLAGDHRERNLAELITWALDRADSAELIADERIAEFKAKLADRMRTKTLAIHPSWKLLSDGEPRTFNEIKLALSSTKGLKAFIDQGVEVGILAIASERPKRYTVAESFRE